ncbi:hypothetical protein M422DRAFT_276440 [Sphaerobolus stellatus SS14]|uniref:Uncharacterized protein n=1 Tax=Sphaerobolus stellatus (strain SS14) TaxID=990650 RepID=A0A0C9UD77_SPHS4|nr:hypothetical protein M422DRAFT_276440 [Sphaerobolus stellatus SS14]
MDVDQGQAKTATAEVYPDGLLLYVSQASYEPGTSPLSLWIPIKPLYEAQESPLAIFERLVNKRVVKQLSLNTSTETAMEQ